jgi:hypothetical protein
MARNTNASGLPPEMPLAPAMASLKQLTGPVDGPLT